MNCEICGEPIEFGQPSTQMVVMRPGGAQVGECHTECQTLGIVGHEYGVCTCTGYDTTSRAAALELWRRMGEKRIG